MQLEQLRGEINRAGRAGISLGDLKEALQKAWMPQNTVKGMRLHRYVAHFPAHFDVAGAAAVGKAFNKRSSSTSPPRTRAAVAAARAIYGRSIGGGNRCKCGRVAAARAIYGRSIGGGHGCNGGRRRACARATAAHRRADKAAFSLLTADEKFAAKKLGYNASAWDAGHAPVATTRRWATLPSKQREAARFLGYAKAEWDAEVVALEEAEAAAAAAAVAAKAAAAAEAAAEADAEKGPTTAETATRPPSTFGGRRRRGRGRRAATPRRRRRRGVPAPAARDDRARGEVTLRQARGGARASARPARRRRRVGRGGGRRRRARGGGDEPAARTLRLYRRARRSCG